MTPVTLVLAYYENAGMLKHQFKTLRALPAKVREFVHVVVVDDGSPKNPATAEDCGCRLQVYRIGVDIRWNQDACRNIGVHHAETEWLLLTDMDHVVPRATWERLVSRGYDASKAYTFARVSAPDMDHYKPHPNSWYMTRKLFERCGGYDERFASLYGTDAEFRERLEQNCQILRLKEPLIRYPREVIPDASTTTYLRKQPEDREGIPRVKATIAALPPEQRKPVRLSFPYERVA